MLTPTRMEKSRDNEPSEPPMEAVPVENVTGMFAIRGAFGKPLGYFDRLPIVEKAEVEMPDRRKQIRYRG